MNHHNDIFDTPSLTKKIFANMKRVGTGFSGEVTSLFDNMLAQALEEVGILQADAQPIPIPTEPLTSKPQKNLNQRGSIPKNPKELMNLCTNLSNKVLELKSEVLDIKSTYKAKIEKLESRVERLKEENMVLKELKGVHSTVDSDEPAYNLDLDHQEKVLSTLDVNDKEPADIEEVVEVVTAAKLITEVVTTARVDVNATKVRQEKEVKVESSKSKCESLAQEIAKKQKMEQEIEKLKKHLQIVLDNDDDMYTYATPLALKILIIDYKIHTKRNRPYFKIIRADGNHMLFMSFSTMLQEKEVKVESSKSKCESLAQEIAKKQKMEKEIEELKKHLQIVLDDDDDVYTYATPLASKILIIDYKIHIERNRPYFKIIRADGNHMLFMSFSTML
nr:hypothetical protein [Tanacetum cinerariifolium]